MVPTRTPPEIPPDSQNPALTSCSGNSDGSSGSDTEKLPEADQQIIGCGDVGAVQKDDGASPRDESSSLEESIKDAIVFHDDDDEVPVNYAEANDQGNIWCTVYHVTVIIRV